MAAFAQSLGQTLGRAGSDYGSAVDANLNTALAVIQNKLTMQEIQQQIRAGDQRMAAEALRMKQMQAPVSVGTYQTVGGVFNVNRDPNTGQVSGGIVPGSQQFFAPPPELSDDAIHHWAGTLPKSINQEQAEDVVRSYRDQGMYPQATAFMGALVKGETKPAMKTLVPDKNSPTGYSEVQWDASGNEITRVPVQPGTGVTGSTSVQTDNLSGLTTTNVRTPNVPRGTPNNQIPVSPYAAPPQTSGLQYPTDLPPSRSDLQPSSPPRRPSATPPTQPKSTADPSLVPWRGVGTYTPEDMQKMAQDWQDFGVKPEGKIAPVVQREMAAHGMTPGEKGTGTLNPVAQKVIIQTDPVIQQIDKLRGDIERLNLTTNNQRGYLLVPYINYKTGSRAPVNSLGDDIAGFSLGSVVEATSALSAQGGGSRALPALRWALEHTPNVWKDSPTLIYKKLADIKDRLAIVENDAKTFGMKGLRVNQPGTPTSQPSQGVIVVTPEDMK